jgi:hypothetical protein
LLFFYGAADTDPSRNLSEESQAAAYAYLSENYTGLKGPLISQVSTQDLIRPVEGADYVSEEVAAAFDDIYDTAGESENIEGFGYRVVSGGSEPQAFSKTSRAGHMG